MIKDNNKTSLFLLLILLFVFAVSQNVFAKTKNSYITIDKNYSAFTLSESGSSAPLFVSSNDYPGVIRILKLLQTDIEKVTDAKPLLSIDSIPEAKEIVIAGTIGKNELIDYLISEKKIKC